MPWWCLCPGEYGSQLSLILRPVYRHGFSYPFCHTFGLSSPLCMIPCPQADFLSLMFIWSIVPNPSVLVLFLGVVLVFMLVSCCCRCLYRLRCRVADAVDAAIDTKCTAAIAITIAPAVAAVFTNAVVLPAAIAALVASAIAAAIFVIAACRHHIRQRRCPPRSHCSGRRHRRGCLSHHCHRHCPRCNHRRLAVAVARVVARSVAAAVAAVVAVAVAAAAMSGHWRLRTCAALVEGRRSGVQQLRFARLATLGLCHLAWLALLGSLHSAHIKVRLQTH